MLKQIIETALTKEHRAKGFDLIEKDTDLFLIRKGEIVAHWRNYSPTYEDIRHEADMALVPEDLAANGIILSSHFV